MAVMNDALAMEDILVAAIESVEGLKDRVCPVVDIQKNTGPLVVYDQRTDAEERSISGDTGLLSAEYEVHCLHSTYKKMRLLAEAVKGKLKGMQGDNSPLLIEAVRVEQTIPDILESKVQLFRRTYNVMIYYQIRGGN